MSEAADSIIHILKTHQAPVGGWDMPGLRRQTGLSIGGFAAALAHLRATGVVSAFDLALASVPAVEPERVAVVPLVQQVAAEVRQIGERRQQARAIGGTSAAHVTLSPGAQFQEIALDGAPALAAAILRDRWGPTWSRVCRHAQATNQRPIAAMIALLDGALTGEVAA